MQVNKLRAYMAMAGVTQADLAKACGITENTMSNKISGRTEFKADEIIKICEVLAIHDAALKSDIFLTVTSQ